MSEWWSSLKPHQRECTWTALFGLTGIALLGVAALVIWMAAPDLMVSEGWILGAAAIGVGWGLVASVGGMLLGFRLEDRHMRKIQSRGGSYRV
jgi:hypothetical protein